MCCPASSTPRCISASPATRTRKIWKAAAAPPSWAGLPAVFEMPNTAPPTTTRVAIEDKLARAKNRMHCDYAFYVGATPANVGALAELEQLPGVCGVKAFLGSSTGTLLLNREDDILAALEGRHRRMAVHSEDEDAPDRAQTSGRPRRSRHASGLARRRNGARVHRTGIAPGASGRPPRACAARHDGGRDCRCSPPPAISPPSKPRRSISRWLRPECYERLGTYAQMNPPIRDAEHRDGAVGSGA